MDIQEQLKMSKQQLDEVQMYLQEQKLTEEDWMNAQAQSDLLDKRLHQDDARFGYIHFIWGDALTHRNEVF